MFRRRRRLFRGLPFEDPSDFPALGVWLRPEVGVTLVSDRVSVWADQSGNGNHFEQAVSDDRPFISAEDLNGLDVPDFQVSEFLVGPSPFDIWTDEVDEDYYVAMVIKLVTHANFSAFLDISRLEDTFNPLLTLQTHNVNTAYQLVFRHNAGVPAAVSFNSPGVGNWGLIEIIKNGPNWSFYRDGTFIFTTDTARVLVVSSTGGDTTEPMRLGMRVDDTNPLVGRIGELVIARQVPSSAQRAGYHSWVETQYGLTIA